jgi:hypothetical protein
MIPGAGWKLETGGYNLNFTNDNPTAGTFTDKMTLTNAGNLSTVGIITGTIINASTALQEAGTNLSSKYLKLDGTNTMSGALT